MVTPRFLPYTGGVEVHVAEVARRLRERGVDVCVITTDPSGRLPRSEVVDSVQVKRLSAWPRGTDWHFPRRMAEAVAEAAPDVVHVQGVHTLTAPMAMLAARRSRIPYVVTFHTGGHPSRLRRWLRPVQWRLLGPLLRNAAVLVAVSQFEAALFRRTLGGSPDIRVIRNGGVAQGSDFVEHTAERSSSVLSIGRLERYKGHHRAIEALPALRRLDSDASLLILGSGPYEPDLRQLAERLGVAQWVGIRFIAPSERQELREVISGAGVVVLLSEYESHPVAVMDALSLGRPVVVAATSGLIELAEAELVRAVPLHASPEALAAVLAAELSNPTHRAGVIPTWDECAQQLLDLYHDIRASR